MSRRLRLQRSIRHFLGAPSRWLDRFARWKLGPQEDVRRQQCVTCHRYVPAWRRYASGAYECIKCGDERIAEGIG